MIVTAGGLHANCFGSIGDRRERADGDALIGGEAVLDECNRCLGVVPGADKLVCSLAQIASRPSAGSRCEPGRGGGR